MRDGDDARLNYNIPTAFLLQAIKFCQKGELYRLQRSKNDIDGYLTYIVYSLLPIYVYIYILYAYSQ